MTDTMRAWEVSAPGPFQNTLKLNSSAKKPSADALKNGQALVKVLRASVNPADYKLPGLGLVSRTMVSYPLNIGMDLAGEVVAVASDVSDTKAGDKVFGRLDPLGKQGGLSEYVIVERSGYATLPEGVDMDQAGAAPTTVLTAYQCIAPYVKAGDKVFLNGGSGGVGTFGIQFAKALGCHVTVTCSAAKADLCKSLGADEIIDYKTTDIIAKLKEGGPQYALCVDNVGNSPPNLYAHAHEFTVPNAPFKFVGGAVTAGSAMSLGKSLLLPGFLGGGKRKFGAFMTNNRREDLAKIAELMAEGKVKTIVDSSFAFEEVPQAYEHLKKGSSVGKIVIRVA